jgi:HAD superfamily hydrolase (TIGR01509 family)
MPSTTSASRSSAPSASHLPAAVLFDMDGTLVDTEPYWFEAEHEVVGRHGDRWDDDKARSLVGLDLRESARRMQDLGGVRLAVDDIVEELLDGVLRRVRRRIPWRPGARELLAELTAAGVPCALVTMSWRRFAGAVVDALPPGSFAAVVTGDEVRHGKPHPEPYLHAAELLGVEPHRCVAIEDSPHGLRSAVAAGCRTIAVPNVVPIPKSDRYRRVSTLTKLRPDNLLDAAPGGAPDAARTRRRRWTAMLALLVGVAALGWLMVGGDDDPPPPPPPPDIPIDAWAPYWQLDHATETVAAYGSWFRQISPLWYATTDATTVSADQYTPTEQAAAFLTAARAAGAAIVVSVQDHMQPGGMAAVLADPQQRAAHVDTLLDLVATEDFDGIDLDYEVFAFGDDRSTWSTTRPLFVTFVAELAARLHADGKLLTVSVPYIYDAGTSDDSGYWVYDYTGLAEHVDQIRIMAYDWSTASPGPIAPVDFVQRAIDGAKDAVDEHSKLVLGVPIYGRNWVLSTTGTCPADTPTTTTAVDQRAIADLVARRNGTVAHDPATGEASFTYTLEASDATGSCTQVRQVNFVDAIGSRLRVDMARTNGLGGAAIYALGDDSDATWTAIGSLARQPAATPPATG